MPYNHSSYCDIIIADLIGIKPQLDHTLIINPLVPDEWAWFCLDRIKYRGGDLTILWDASGERYGKGKGFQVIFNGKKIFSGKQITKVQIKLDIQ